MNNLPHMYPWWSCLCSAGIFFFATSILVFAPLLLWKYERTGSEPGPSLLCEGISCSWTSEISANSHMDCTGSVRLSTNANISPPGFLFFNFTFYSTLACTHIQDNLNVAAEPPEKHTHADEWVCWWLVLISGWIQIPMRIKSVDSTRWPREEFFKVQRWSESFWFKSSKVTFLPSGEMFTFVLFTSSTGHVISHKCQMTMVLRCKMVKLDT